MSDYMIQKACNQIEDGIKKQDELYEELELLKKKLEVAVEALDSMNGVESLHTISDSDEEEWWLNGNDINHIVEEVHEKIKAMDGEND
jgi:hypothetical protein